ncbi:MAG: hypothetical protein KDA24_14805 [Deltaproteobacteria bacterium]|nr:hypothetical protein [Deltaproteobacteria bacterium]
MRTVLLIVALLGILAIPTVALGQAEVSDEFAPEPEPLAVGFRGDFGLIWAITDGQGMSDHAAITGTWGPQFGDAGRGLPPALAPVVTASIGIAEGGEFSLRVGGGLEVVGGIVPNVEFTAQVLGGYLRQFDNDLRAGPFFKVGAGIRLLGRDHVWVQFEPFNLVVLPPPPGGFTRYTSHIAVDVALVRFGGRTR